MNFSLRLIQMYGAIQSSQLLVQATPSTNSLPKAIAIKIEEADKFFEEQFALTKDTIQAENLDAWTYQFGLRKQLYLDEIKEKALLEMEEKMAPQAQERGEKPEVILENIRKHVPAWAQAVDSLKDIKINKMNGLSNSCYKVELKDNIEMADSTAPRSYLYRKLECQVVDLEIEKTIFKSMSDSGQGPALIAQNEDYRIEGFIDGRVISIWEMRNPVMMENFVKALFEMHTQSGVGEAVQKIKPLDKANLGIDMAIYEWGPAVIARIDKIMESLNLADPGHAHIDESLELLVKTYLKPGYQQALRDLVPRDNIVFSHNDCQENNILSSYQNGADLVLIDYEYGMWNPAAYDLGTYLNEMVCDNAYAKEPGFKYYWQNWPTESEIEEITKHYFLLSKKHEGQESTAAEWSMQDPQCVQAVRETKQNMILNSFYWAMWSIMMITEAEETDPKAYYWDYIIERCQMHEKYVQDFGFGQLF